MLSDRETAAGPALELKRKVSKPGPECISFDLRESEQYVDHLQAMSPAAGRIKGGVRWLCLVAAGLGAGCVASSIQLVLKNVSEFKLEMQQELFEAEQPLGIRFLVWLSSSLFLAGIAGVLVCFVEPLAGGSGIPEIKCVLNGVEMPNVLRLRTLLCKAFGIVCSVAAGLPCGKEGPMIHSGAIVAAQASELTNVGPLAAPFRDSVEARDLVAAGAAAGVAAAFGAPIGGVLFAVEEGASHMNPTILVRTFVCASVAALTVRFFAGPMDGLTSWGTMGTDVPVEFGRFTERSYQMWELPVFAVMGVGGGLLGALFNGLNTRLSLWRMRHVGPRGLRRFAEVLLVTAAIVSFNFFMPLLKGGSDAMRSFCPAQRLFVEPGGEAIKDLFHGTEHINPGLLLAFAVSHYMQTIWTYGIGVPSGLFVPSLLAGAACGRILGQAVHGGGVDAGVYALIGATAMLSGMARITISLAVILMETTGEAEWGVPIFLVVMAAKWTGDLFNKGIYDIHIELRHVPLLEHRAEKGMLWLRARDCMATQVDCLPVCALVQDIVNMLQKSGHHAFPIVDKATGRFLGLLERSAALHVLLLARKHGALLREGGVADAEGAMKVGEGVTGAGDPEAGKAGTATASARVVPFNAMLRSGFPGCPPVDDVLMALAPEDMSYKIDLLPYSNRGCYTVQEHAAALRCYMLFRAMGLRHLPVLGEDHTVRGMLTRKDILAGAEYACDTDIRHTGSAVSEALAIAASCTPLSPRKKRASSSGALASASTLEPTSSMASFAPVASAESAASEASLSAEAPGMNGVSV